MQHAFRRAMDGLYLLCVVISGIALVVISAVIPWSVFTRYVLNRAASWPEPMAILLTIVLTFFGAAACYRINLHMDIKMMTDRLSPAGKRVCAILSELLMAATGLFMAVWGFELVRATWNQVIAEFPFLSVGLTYLPIPLGGLFLTLFVIERLTIGRPPPGWADADGAEHFE